VRGCGRSVHLEVVGQERVSAAWGRETYIEADTGLVGRVPSPGARTVNGADAGSGDPAYIEADTGVGAVPSPGDPSADYNQMHRSAIEAGVAAGAAVCKGQGAGSLPVEVGGAARP